MTTNTWKQKLNPTNTWKQKLNPTNTGKQKLNPANTLRQKYFQETLISFPQCITYPLFWDLQSPP